MPLSALEEHMLARSTAQAAEGTTGAVHVVVEARALRDVDERVIVVWEELGLVESPAAVLLYVAEEERQVRAMAGHLVNEAVDDEFWGQVVSLVGQGFGRGEPMSGLSDAVMQLGEVLRAVAPVEA